MTENIVPAEGLLSLPDLVVDSITHHLEHRDLLTLRLVCKTTNSWITQNSKLLKKLKLQISTEETLIEVIKSPVLWNHIKFDLPPGHLKHDTVVLEFLKKCGPFIQILNFDVVDPKKEWDITSCNPRPPFLFPNQDILTVTIKVFKMIFEFCPSLHSLRIGRLQLTQDDEIANSINNLKTNYWKSLKVLDIQDLICCEKEDYQSFEDILMCLPSLEILGFSKTPYNNLTEYLLTPLINYIVSQISNGNCTLKLVNFGINTISDISESSKNKFLELAKACHISKTVIVLPIVVPCDTKFILLSEVHLGQTLENIEIQLGEAIPPLAELKLTNLKRFYIGSFYDTETVNNNNQALLQSYEDRNMHFKMPKLQEVYLDVGKDYNETDGRLLIKFINFMTSVSFPSVRTLCFSQGKNSFENPFRLLEACKICQGFPNLVKLKLSCWEGSADEFVTLWIDLKLLEEVSLHHCPLIGDYSIIGVTHDGEHYPLLRLKYLKRIHISGCGRITDKSYRLIFQHLKLEYFYHNNNYENDLIRACDHFPFQHYDEPDVTKVGLKYLTEGDFCKSIETMNIFNFSFEWDHKNNEFDEFLDNFPNLENRSSIINPTSPRCMCLDGGLGHSDFAHVMMIILLCLCLPFVGIYLLVECGRNFCYKFISFVSKHRWVLPLFMSSVLMSLITLIYLKYR